jgi:hypothetical protein
MTPGSLMTKARWSATVVRLASVSPAALGERRTAEGERELVGGGADGPAQFVHRQVGRFSFSPVPLTAATHSPERS